MTLRLMLKLVICLAVFSAAVAALGAGSPAAKTTAAQVESPVDLQFSDTPLPVALDAMFKGTGKSYVLDPSLAQFRVKAVLKNVSWETALTQLLSALGGSYYVGKDGVYHIGAAQQQVVTQQAFGGMVSNNAPAAQSAPQIMNSSLAPQGPITTKVIDTKYLNAAEAANAIANTPGVASVSATNGYRVVISGTQEANDNASQVIAGLDTDKALPRPVRLRMSAKVTVGTTRGPKTYEATTESVGAEQSQVMLHLDVRELIPVNKTTPEHRPKAAPNNVRIPLVYSMIVPSLNPDGRIGLVGRGSFAFPVGPGASTEVTKEFVVTASVEAGKPFTIAAGSMRQDVGNIDFVVTVTATQEPGRVYLSPSQNSILNAVPGPPASAGGDYNGPVTVDPNSPQGRNW